MNFASDNWAGAHPAIAGSLVEHAAGYAAAYGASDLDRAVERRFSELFERDVSVFFVSTGTAANSLGLSAVSRPGGVVFCHTDAHVTADEGGAPEFLSGQRLYAVEGGLGRIDPARLEAAVARYPTGFVHAGQPAAVTITQSTEIGTLYSLDEIEAIAQVARGRGLPLHMDGARFANAIAALGASPAEMTWKRGVDLLSFGGTKNGCWCAEALVFFDPDAASQFPYIRKRAAQLFSKSRFIAAQFDTYLRDGLWLDNARHANAMAARLAAAIEQSAHARLGWQPQANEVFAIVETARAERLQAAGARFYPWHPPYGCPEDIRPGEALYRFVTSFATREDDIASFAESLG